MSENTKKICRQLAKPLGFLMLLIMICAFLAQYLTGQETLAEYAEKNPELAYASQIEASGTDDVSSEKGTVSDDAGNPANASTSDTLDSPSAYTKTDNPAQEPSGTTDLTNTTGAVTESSGIANLPGTPDAVTESSGLENNVQNNKEYETMTDNPDRITYQPGFYYEPLNEDIKKRITGISYPVAESHAAETAVPAINMIADDLTPAVSYDDLRYVSILHYDFNGKEKEGELICNKAIAQDMVEIFYELYQNDYQIEQIRLVDEYNGDDTLSMLDNNTSCFNYRVVDGTDSLSKHAYGLAIDINPFYNPYIVFGKGENGSDYISPAGSEVYADRSRNFAYKIDETDLCYRLFKEHGFTWGGDWNSCKDYQHFQKALK